MKTTKKKTPENPTPYPLIYHFSRKRYPFRIPFICCKYGSTSTYPVQNFVSLLTAVNHSQSPLITMCKSTVFFFTQKSISKIACTQKLFYFSFRSYPLALAVNKFPAFYILSPTLDGLCRGNRGSVNRLSQKQNVLSTSQSHIIHLLTSEITTLFYTAISRKVV